MKKFGLLVSIAILSALLFFVILTNYGTSKKAVVSGKAQEVNTCPDPDNAACYDCNGDDEVNILDFSCFSETYGKNY